MVSHIIYSYVALRYPEYRGDELVPAEDTLFTEKELFLILDCERGGKNLVWNNFFNEIGPEKQY